MITYLDGRITSKEISGLIAALVASCFLPFFINGKLFGDKIKTTTNSLKSINKNLAFTNSQLNSTNGEGRSADSLKRQIALIKKELKKKGINPEENAVNKPSATTADTRAELMNAQIVTVLQRAGIRVKSTRPGKTGDAANSRDIEAIGSFLGLRTALLGLESAKVNIEALKLVNNIKTKKLTISLSLTF